MAQNEHQSNLPRSPNEFASLLISDYPLFIVGGQAVNLWALYYYKYTAELEPFVSRDIDILGDNTTLADMARNIGVEPCFFSKRSHTNMVGAIFAKSRDGQPLLVEVLKYVYGVKNEDLTKRAYTIQIGKDNISVRVPNPIVLLQAKIANVADLSQDERQDKHHIEILTKLMPAYLTDIYSTVVNGKIKEREMIKILESLITVITSTNGYNVLGELNIPARSLFPNLEQNTQAKLHLFMTKRLAMIFPEH
ncbi:MAG: hypothetical protein L3J71_09790 [Victivallaceae bacterium]|nr:hypothetical protein [Victivallaceae bacterium]